MHATSFTKAFAQQCPVCIIPPRIPCISFFILIFLYFPSSSFYTNLRIFASFVFSCLFLHSPASFPSQQKPSRVPLVSSETTPSGQMCRSAGGQKALMRDTDRLDSQTGASWMKRPQCLSPSPYTPGMGRDTFHEKLFLPHLSSLQGVAPHTLLYFSICPFHGVQSFSYTMVQHGSPTRVITMCPTLTHR